uniref:Probable G-protein coupled receptor 33 n=1 Tax=Salvator merianae TaxID=96440 RepID=A0A8D0BDR5_SALMN
NLLLLFFTSTSVKPQNVAVGILILVSFLVGVSVNSFFLWVLGVKMARTVNTLWFIHLTLIHLILCSLLPLFAAYVIIDFNWIFGVFMCKLVSYFFSVGMFTTIFLLTIISSDRYLFTCHSVWSQQHRTLSWACRLIAGVWVVSLALSVPSLFFWNIMDGTQKCEFNISFFENWDSTHVGITFYFIHFLVAFLLPFIVILICYCCIVREMKKKGFLRSRKTLKVLISAVASFFICWLPYHLYHVSLLIKDVRKETVNAIWYVMAAGICFNICFTPIIYLFVGEKFQQIFKMSIVALIRKGLSEHSKVEQTPWYGSHPYRQGWNNPALTV